MIYFYIILFRYILILLLLYTMQLHVFIHIYIYIWKTYSQSLLMRKTEELRNCCKLFLSLRSEQILCEYAIITIFPGTFVIIFSFKYAHLQTYNLDCKEIQPVHSKGNQSWVFFGRTDAKAETPIWPPHAKS